MLVLAIAVVVGLLAVAFGIAAVIHDRRQDRAFRDVLERGHVDVDENAGIERLRR